MDAFESGFRSGIPGNWTVLFDEEICKRIVVKTLAARNELVMMGLSGRFRSDFC
jgi:hypothetical protein